MLRLSNLQIFCSAPRWCNSYQQYAEVQLCWGAWPPSCCFFVPSSVPRVTFLLLSFCDIALVSNLHLLCAHANTHLDCSRSAVRHEWGVGKGLTGDSNCCLTDKWWNACWCNCNEGIIWQARGYIALTLPESLLWHSRCIQTSYTSITALPLFLQTYLQVNPCHIPTPVFTFLLLLKSSVFRGSVYNQCQDISVQEEVMRLWHIISQRKVSVLISLQLTVQFITRRSMKIPYLNNASASLLKD